MTPQGFEVTQVGAQRYATSLRIQPDVPASFLEVSKAGTDPAILCIPKMELRSLEEMGTCITFLLRAMNLMETWNENGENIQ